MTIFETSFEVCNPVGGIYTVLSSRADLMQKQSGHNVYFFGPLFEQTHDIFKENKTLLKDWKKQMAQEGISVKVGRWRIKGNPIAILVDWSHLWEKKDEIYAHFWEKFGVQSHQPISDYDTCSLFGYAVGQAMQSLYLHLRKTQEADQYLAHFNEWQTGFGLLYLKENQQDIHTLFTTHATGIGRSIAFNNKPLYDYFEGYNGDQMAQELGFISKHSIEKMAAKYADCFTTVSETTARECAQLLEKKVDIVTPNGFDSGIVPSGKAYEQRRQEARQMLTTYAQSKGIKVGKNDAFICISGRAEWKNKGIDVFLDAIAQLDTKLKRKKVVAFVLVPYLQQENRFYSNSEVLFVPFYLDGNDPIFGVTYYDLLIGMDLTIFPSYYEPWGYTPLESIAFHIPTITSSLAGFGLWARAQGCKGLEDGVVVIERTDSNYLTVVDEVVKNILHFLSFTTEEKEKCAKKAHKLSLLADWKHFLKYYDEAYKIALKK